MIETIVIEAVSIKTASSSGIPYTEKRTNRSQKRVAIKPKDSDQWIANFVFDGDPALDWKKGDTVSLDIEKNGDFVNWKHADAVKPTIPKKVEPNLKTQDDVIIELLREINGKLDALTATEHNSKQ